LGSALIGRSQMGCSQVTANRSSAPPIAAIEITLLPRAEGAAFSRGSFCYGEVLAE
jgi:hypothetical protein